MVELTETILCLAEMQNVTELLFSLEFHSAYFINLVVILWMVTKENSRRVIRVFFKSSVSVCTQKVAKYDQTFGSSP